MWGRLLFKAFPRRFAHREPHFVNPAFVRLARNPAAFAEVRPAVVARPRAHMTASLPEGPGGGPAEWPGRVHFPLLPLHGRRDDCLQWPPPAACCRHLRRRFIVVL